MGLPTSSEDWALSEYVHSDYMTDIERDAEADIPVPDRLLPTRRYRELVAALRLSQKIGLLIWIKHQMRELNRRPQSKHFRQSQSRRIGVGYRDKGMLPEQSLRARRAAWEDSFIPTESLSQRIRQFLKGHLPESLTEDEEWVDLSVLSRAFGSRSDLRLETLLHPL